MCAQVQDIDVNASLFRHISMLKPWVPRQAIVSAGEYSSQILLKNSYQNAEQISTLFLEQTNPKSTKFRAAAVDPSDILSLDAKADTHYWFNVEQALANDASVIEKLKGKCADKLDEAIIVGSAGEGVGSAFLPELAAKFNDWKVNSVAFSVLPSAAQPPDAYFNTLYALAAGSGKDLTQIILDRDNLESYIGVDRKGTLLSGSNALNYVLDLALAKEQFVQEICELSRSFNVKFFSVLAATGASLKVYGNLQNILSTTMLRPLLSTPLTDATVLYVLIRMPSTLKRSLSKGKIELTIVHWFKDKADLKSVYVSEPMYVEDGSDRIDVVMFLGGFSLTERIAQTNRKIKDIKTYAEKSGFIKEKEWQKLIGSLTA